MKLEPKSAEKKKQGLFLTQDDIDVALRGADISEAVIDADDNEAFILDEADIIDPDSEELDYFGLLSKEDIEALLQGNLVGSDGDNAQDVIDSLLGTAGSENNAASPPEDRKTPEEEGAVSQDDIDRLLMSAIDDSEEDAGESPAAGPETPEEAGVVSQDDIDLLLMGAMDQTDLEAETDSGGVSVETQGPPASRMDIGSGISQVDLDQLMGEAISEGDTEEVSDRDDDTPSEHISQGDINRLLKESLEEEDFLEEEAAEESDAIDEADTTDEADSTEPVILAVGEDLHESTAPIPEQSLASRPRKTALGGFRKKRLLAGVAAGIVLALTVSMMMLPGQEETVLHPQVLTFSVPKPDGAGHGARSVSATSVYLTGFVVLAPPNSAAITYVNADLLLDLSDATFVDVIKENEAFVRDIVYGTISSELMTRDISTIDEISLELAIRKELGRIIPRGAIERIDFERFSMA